MTDESPELVDGWVKKYKPSYPIVCLKDGKFEKFLGVEFFPTAAVIAPDGTLSYSGSSSSVNGPLGKAMANTDGPLYPKAFNKVTKAMYGKDFSKSYAELLKLIGKGKLAGEELTVASQLRAYLEGTAVTALSDAKAFRESGKIYCAVLRVESYSKSKTAFPASADIAALIAEMEAAPDFKKEMSGGKKYAMAAELEEASEFADAFASYKSTWKKFSGTRISQVAETNARAIADGGKAGWKRTCTPCRRDKEQRACAKHLKKTKL